MSVIRIARPRTCKHFIHHGLTLGCLLRLTTLRAGELVCLRVSGNSHTRRVVARQIRRAIAATDSKEWLIAVHANNDSISWRAAVCNSSPLNLGTSKEIMMNSGIRSGFSPVGLSLRAAEIAEAVHEFETAYPMFAGVPIEDMLAGTGDIKCEHRCLGDDVVVTIVAPLYGIVFTRSF